MKIVSEAKHQPFLHRKGSDTAIFPKNPPQGEPRVIGDSEGESIYGRKVTRHPAPQ